MVMAHKMYNSNVIICVMILEPSKKRINLILRNSRGMLEKRVTFTNMFYFLTSVVFELAVTMQRTRAVAIVSSLGSKK